MGRARAAWTVVRRRGSPPHRLSNIVTKIRRAKVGSNEEGFVDAFHTQMLPLTRSG